MVGIAQADLNIPLNGKHARELLAADAAADDGRGDLAVRVAGFVPFRRGQRPWRRGACRGDRGEDRVFQEPAASDD